MVLAVHPSHRFAGRRGRGRPRARRRDVRGLRRRAVDPPRHRPLPPPSRCHRRGRARVRQHREHQAGRRDPRGRRRSSPSRPSAARSGRGRSCAVRIEGQDPKYRLNRPAGDHPPPARQPRPDGLAVPGTADRDGDRSADPAPTRIQSSRAGRLVLVSLQRITGRRREPVDVRDRPVRAGDNPGSCAELRRDRSSDSPGRCSRRRGRALDGEPRAAEPRGMRCPADSRHDPPKP